MPELPEVECLTRAVRKVLEGGTIVRADFLRKDLRDPIPIEEFNALVVGAKVDAVYRRSKYMLWRTKKGFGVIHLGMTGNLLLRDVVTPSQAHTHAVFSVRDADGGKKFLHFVDPRRFGRIGCVEGSRDEDLAANAMFESLGVEPLEMTKLGDYLFEKSRKKKAPIKSFIMDAGIVVGVGNIYASESLFRAGINPKRAAGRVTRDRYGELGLAIQETLRAAIKAGGTTFRDFKNSDGNPGYFAVSLAVYGRSGEPCSKCRKTVKTIRQSGRSTFFCDFCQS